MPHNSVTEEIPAGALTLVSAADARYGRCLWQFLRSAERARVFQRGHRVVVWDLGLENSQLDRLRRQFPQVQFHPFAYDRHPSHAHPSRRTYAWKPLVLVEAAKLYGPRLVWLDSAALLHDDLTEVSAALDQHGMYALNGQAPLKDRGHVGILREIGVSAEALDSPEFAAGVIGFDLAHAGARGVFERWTALAQNPAFWRPVELAHNLEQALLSAVIRRALADGEVTLSPGEIDISSPNPIRWTTSRNKVPPWLPEWIDPLARAWFGLYKAVDQFGIRLQAFRGTAVKGEP